MSLLAFIIESTGPRFSTLNDGSGGWLAVVGGLELVSAANAVAAPRVNRTTSETHTFGFKRRTKVLRICLQGLDKRFGRIAPWQRLFCESTEEHDYGPTLVQYKVD